MNISAYIQGFIDAVKYAGAEQLLVKEAAPTRMMSPAQLESFTRWASERCFINRLWLARGARQARESLERGLRSAGNKAWDFRVRKGLTPLPYGTPLISPEKAERVRIGSFAAAVKQDPDTYKDIRSLLKDWKREMGETGASLPEDGSVSRAGMLRAIHSHGIVPVSTYTPQ